MKNRIISLSILFALCVTALIPSASASAKTYATTKSDKVPAVALGDPYCITLSIQNNKLVLSGFAPDYVADSSLQVDIIKPVNYGSCTIDTDGRAMVGKDATKAIKSVLKEVGPLDTISGYDKLWEYDGADEPKLKLVQHKRVTAYVNGLLERNPDLNPTRTRTLLHCLHKLGCDLGSTASIVKVVLDTYPTIDLSYILMDTILATAPNATKVVKTIKHPLTCTNYMAPIITSTTIASWVKEYYTDKDGNVIGYRSGGKYVETDTLPTEPCLTYDFANVPMLDLSNIPDGVYNIRVGLTTAPLEKIYHDDILIVIKNSKASLQILKPTYKKDAPDGYTGYTLSHYWVQPAITAADYSRWN